tara:strand:+ start:3672 stop:4571 length:900 start_codon:yes stop_codon:yes gene_type:complete
VKKIVIKIIVAFAGILAPIPDYSQNGLEVLKLEYSYHPGSMIKNSNGAAFESVSRIFRGTLRAPVFVSEKWQVLGSVQFKNFQTEQDEYAFLKNISGVATNFTAFRKGRKWSLYAASEIGYSSGEWSGISADDLILRGSAGAVQLRKGVIEMFGLGIGSSSDFGVPTILPIIFLKMKMNEKLQLETILPLQSRFSFHWKPNTFIGLQHSANYNAFVVSNNFRTDELKFGKIRNMTGGIFWEQKLYKNLWLTASGGALFRNVVFLYDKNRLETDKLVGGMNYFVNLKLSVKMNKNEGNFN